MKPSRGHAPRRVVSDDDDLRAFGGERSDGRGADAVAAASDQRDPAFEFVHDHLRLLFSVRLSVYAPSTPQRR